MGFFVNFISCTSIPLISPTFHILPPSLQPSPKTKQKIKIIKNKDETNKNKQTKIILPWKLQCVMVTQCVTQSTFLSKYLSLQMFVAVSHWTGSRLLASATLSILGPEWDSSPLLLLPCAMEILQLCFCKAMPSCFPEVLWWSKCRGEPTQSPGPV